MTPAQTSVRPAPAGTQMAREIAEQPAALERTVADLTAPGGPLTRVAALAAGRRHLRLAARGTSDNAATYGRYLAEVLRAVPTALAIPSVSTHYRTSIALDDTLFVSLSQSGRTREVVDVQDAARRAGAATVAVTNTAGSPLAEGADLALVTSAGPELAVPATKTFTTQLLAMALLVDHLDDRRVLPPGALAALPDQVRAVVESSAGPADRAAQLLATAGSSSGGPGARGDVVVVSRGICLAVAQESALKLEETCLRPVRGLSAADLRHGPMAVVGPGTALVVIAPGSGPLLGQLVDLARTASDAGAAVVGLGGGRALAAAVDVHVPAADGVDEALAPIPLVVAGQLLAERLALASGLDPDAPRGLSKVTQTD